jgi:uncharacterized membrane protein YbhN (UPF0104 family)
MYGVALGLLAGLAWWNWDPGNGKGLKDALSKPVQLGPLALAALAVFAALALSMFRWYLLVRALDIPLRVADAYRLGAVGYFFSQFLPGSVSGDVVKVAFLGRREGRWTAAAASALVDRVIGVWALAWLVAFVGGGAWALGNPSLASNPALQVAVLAAGGVVGASVAVWLGAGLLSAEAAERWARRLQGVGRLGGVLAELWRAGWMYQRRPLTVTAALGISLVSQTCLLLAFFCCGHTFQDPAAPTPVPTLGEHFVFFPLGELLQTVPFLPGGAGLAEAGFAGLYKLSGFSENTGLNVALLYRALLWGWGLVSVGAFLGAWPSLRPADQPAAEELALAEA